MAFDLQYKRNVAIRDEDYLLANFEEMFKKQLN